MEVYTDRSFISEPDELYAESLVNLLETAVREETNLVIKCSHPESGPGGRSACLGYFPDYGYPYLSSPCWQTGLIGIDTTKKRLIFQENATPISNSRDLYRFRQAELIVKGVFEDVVKAFTEKKYQEFIFDTGEAGEDRMSNYKSDFTQAPTR